MRNRILLLMIITVLVGVHCIVPLRAQEGDFPTLWTNVMPNTASVSQILFSHNSQWLIGYKGKVRMF